MSAAAISSAARVSMSLDDIQRIADQCGPAIYRLQTQCRRVYAISNDFVGELLVFLSRVRFRRFSNRVYRERVRTSRNQSQDEVRRTRDSHRYTSCSMLPALS